MNDTSRINNLGTVKECVIQLGLLLIAIIIGIISAWNFNDYATFYIAVLLQAINNCYDASKYLQGYTLLITLYGIIYFLISVGCGILSILHFTEMKNYVDVEFFRNSAIIGLSLPVVALLTGIYVAIRSNRY